MSKFLSHFVTSFKSVRTEFWTTYGEKVLLVFYNVPFYIIIQSEKGFSGMSPVFGLFFLAQMLFHLFPCLYPRVSVSLEFFKKPCQRLIFLLIYGHGFLIVLVVVVLVGRLPRIFIGILELLL